MPKPIEARHLQGIVSRLIPAARSQEKLATVRSKQIDPILKHQESYPPEMTRLALLAETAIRRRMSTLPEKEPQAAPQEAERLSEPSGIDSISSDLDFLLDAQTIPAQRAGLLLHALDKKDSSREQAIEALANEQVVLTDLEGSHLQEIYLKLRTSEEWSNDALRASEVVFTQLENHPEQLVNLVTEMTRKKVALHLGGIEFLRSFAGDPSTDTLVRDTILQYLKSVPPAMPVLTPPPPLTSPVRLPAPVLDNSVFSSGDSTLIIGYDHFNLGGLGAIADIGCRKEQQDAVLLATKNGRILALAADGMGGHNGGAIASGIAVSVNDQSFMMFDDYTLQHGVLLADEEVKKAAANDPRNLAGMGTTFSAILFEGRKYYTQILGDTRIYRLRNGELTILSLDDCQMAKDNLANLTDKKDNLTLPMDEHTSIQYHDGINSLVGRNVINNALGVGQPSLKQAGQGEVEPGDIFFICTDGLHGYITFEEMKRVAADNQGKPAAEVSEALQLAASYNMIAREDEKAQKEGRAPRDSFGDNISVVTVKIDDDVLTYLDSYAPTVDQRHTAVYESTPPTPPAEPEVEITVETEVEGPVTFQLPAPASGQRAEPSVVINEPSANPFLSNSGIPSGMDPFDPFPTVSRTADTVVNRPQNTPAAKPKAWPVRLLEWGLSFLGFVRSQEITKLTAEIKKVTDKAELEAMGKIIAEEKLKRHLNRTINIAARLKAGELINHNEALDLTLSFQRELLAENSAVTLERLDEMNDLLEKVMEQHLDNPKITYPAGITAVLIGKKITELTGGQ